MAVKTKVVTGKVRLSYVHVFEPHSFPEKQEKKYSVCVLIPKSDKTTLQKIKSAIEAAEEAGSEKFGAKWAKATHYIPLRDGDAELEEEKKDGDEYKGHYFINVSSKIKPGVVDSQVQPILDSTEVYSGCYGRVSINFYPYDTAGNKGIGAGLNNVQKLADGEFLGGRSRAEDDFEVEEEDEEDFL